MKNHITQSNAAMAMAIAYFAKMEYIVSIPLSRHQSYDLIVDASDGDIKMVKVVSTTHRRPSGSYQAKLVYRRFKKSKYFNYNFDCSLFDLVFVVCDYTKCYCIPAEYIKGRSSINTDSYLEFTVSI